ncbi:hypothetical protein [Methylobacterium sp. CM6247]
MGRTTLWREDFLVAGYKPYRDGLKDSGERHTPIDDRMYQGSVQKRVRDYRGTRYFINVDLYDFTKARQDGLEHRSVGPNVQFSVRDDMDETVDVSGVQGDTIAEIEAFFANLWSRMRWGYYEVDRPEVAPSLALPASAIEGGTEP